MYGPCQVPAGMGLDAPEESNPFAGLDWARMSESDAG